jgi:hypothetical protein
MEIYGFIMMDAGYNFDQIHPDWFDVVRPTNYQPSRTSMAQMVTSFSQYAKHVWVSRIILKLP